MPYLGAFVSVSVVAWQISKIKDGIKKLRDSIDRLATCDYKTSMTLFKDLILIPITNEVYPSIDNINQVYVAAESGCNKLSEKEIGPKMELIRIQMFCQVYKCLYDESTSTLRSYEKIPRERRETLRDIFNDKLKYLDHLSEMNRVEYYSKKSFTAKGKSRNQEILDTIDHIKKTSYSITTITDKVFELQDVVLKVWSLK